MIGVGTHILKSFYAGAKLISRSQSFQSYGSCRDLSECTRQFLPTSPCLNIFNRYSVKGRPSRGNTREASVAMLLFPSLVDIQYCRTTSNNALRRDTIHFGSSFVPLRITGMPFCRAYSSHTGREGIRDAQVPATASGGENTNVGGSDWVDSLKLAYQSSVDAALNASEKAKEAYEKLKPYIMQMVDLHPQQGDIIIPVGGTVCAALLAWLVMPRLLRILHKYSMRSHIALISGNLPREQVPYERSIWGALEDPVRYLITFMAFSQLASLIAPTTIASQYIAQAWRAGVIISFIWFLHRWKKNVLTGALVNRNITGLDLERLLALDKLSSMGLLVLGLMATAEAFGVAVQSILTVGGIGGVATAFAARDILGNMFNGLSIQFTMPFSVGDTIKAGSIEGQVLEIGLTTTSLLNSEKFPITVPNSMFSSQVIVNRSRAQMRAIMTKIPVFIEDLEMIPQVSDDIKAMLRSNSKVFLGAEPPYCFLSRIEASYGELTVGCNLKKMYSSFLGWNCRAKRSCTLRNKIFCCNQPGLLSSMVSDLVAFFQDLISNLLPVDFIYEFT
ncbi:mechanosensitive ion channel protein 1, mitochondrial-like isoform X2 [Tasmannia lanceolata]|uniref:mechanosensitive ion channel protein 1, mitochondrial-like isoform X2 n=1 Tax=Tasmannia lanceolata TaxID=3420 RepID=UPI004063661C